MIDSQVMTLISNSLEPQLSETFYSETTLKLWQAIKIQSSTKTTIHKYQLKKEFAKIQQESKGVSELIGFVRSKYEELKLYRPPTTDLSML
jgi:hypothetical protein